MDRSQLLLGALASTLICCSTASAVTPPKIYIDKGACPFECCTYRAWKVTKDTDLFDKVDGTKIVGRAKAGQTVQGVTGEVHTKPMKVKVKTHPGAEPLPKEIKNGDDVYVLTSQGEGFWKVWKNGRVISDVSECWDEANIPESTWWVKIKLKDGTTGWTKSSENFSGIDACG
jgi:hypothetical protein